MCGWLFLVRVFELLCWVHAGMDTVIILDAISAFCVCGENDYCICFEEDLRIKCHGAIAFILHR